MIDHIGIRVRNVAACRRFYTEALAPLGYQVLMDFGAAVGFGAPGAGPVGQPDFWVISGGDGSGGTHVAFTVSERAHVDEFFSRGVAAGGRDNGPPGPRPHYHPGYYGAFVLDPEGNNIEAVFHGSQAERHRARVASGEVKTPVRRSPAPAKAPPRRRG